MKTTRPPDRHEIVRRANQRAVLDAVLAAAPISRSGIGVLTHLSKPVVLAVVAELEQTGLIRRNGQAGGRVGRSPVLYATNPQAGFIAGIDLGGTKLRAAIADLDGIVLHEDCEPTSTGGGTAVGDQIIELVRRLAKRAGVASRQLTAIAIGSPGVADPEGRMQLAVNVSGLGDVALAEHLHAKFAACEVVVENDVNIAAIGERTEGSGVGCDDLVVLSIGTGIGAGIIVNGRLMRGHSGAAGEVAWLPIGSDPATRAARTRGALELAGAGDGVRRALRSAISEHGGSILGPRASVAEIFAAAAAGDGAAQAVVAAEANLIARAVMAVVAVVDPEKVVLAGGIGANPLLLAPVVAHLHRLSPLPIRVESSKLGERSGVVGALALARGLARSRLFGEANEVHR